MILPRHVVLWRSRPTLGVLLIDEYFLPLLHYTAYHRAVVTFMLTYILASLPLPLYCGILLLAKQHETKLVSILYCSSMSSSCILLRWAVATSMSTCSIILLNDEQFLYFIAYHLAVETSMPAYSIIILLIDEQFFILYCSDEQLRLLCHLIELYCSSTRSSCHTAYHEQLQLPCWLIVLYCSSASSSCIIILLRWAVATSMLT